MKRIKSMAIFISLLIVNIVGTLNVFAETNIDSKPQITNIEVVSNKSNVSNTDRINNLIKSNKKSNEYVHQSIINLEKVNNGQITITTYSGVNEEKTTKVISVSPQKQESATDKITRFVFELSNRYRPETHLVLSIDSMNAHIYTAGSKMDRSINAIKEGTSEALDNPPIMKDDENNSWIDKFNPDYEEPIDECFIATASYGSKFTPSVMLLRQFRDEFLLTNKAGQAFVAFYYENSPPIANFISESEFLKFVVRALLTPIVGVVYLLSNPVLAVVMISGLALIYRKIKLINDLRVI